jgi:hypothetical protein
MTKLPFISVVGISLSCAALAHEGHEHATGVVRDDRHIPGAAAPRSHETLRTT